MFLKRATTCCLVATLAACSSDNKPKAPEAEPVAKVNGEVIAKAEFDDQVERNLARYRGQSDNLPPGIETRIKESVLRRMIDDAVIMQKAKELGVTATDDEITAKFQEHKARFRTEQAFADYLKRANNTEENMKAELMRNTVRDRVVEKLSGAVEVSEAEVADYFEKNKQRFVEKEQIKAGRILVRMAPGTADAERKNLQAQAQALRAKAAKKDADFAALARDNSNGPEAARGGELGWFSRGRFPAAFDDAAFALNAGQVSAVVETNLGFEIIKAWEKKPERPRTLDEVRQNIQNSLMARRRNEKRREVLRDLKKTAQVEKLVEFDRPEPGQPQMAMPERPNMPMQPGNPVVPGMPPPGMAQPGMPQPGMPQPGMPQPGMPQPGMPQPGMAQQPGGEAEAPSATK